MSRKAKFSAAYALLFFYLAIPVILWSLASESTAWSSGSAILRSIGQLSGLVGASLLALNFVLSARLKPIEELMNGLPRVYVAHHLHGGLALILLLGHPLFLGLQYLPSSLNSAADFFIPSLNDIPKLLGNMALGVLVVLLVITFFIRIPYQKWRSTHQWLGLALLLGALHVYLIPGNLTSTPYLRVYMVIVILSGLAAFSYRTLFGRWLVPRKTFKVKSVTVHPNGTEVVLAPVESKLNYRSGQFLFFRVHNASGITKEPHPFSITSAPDEKNLSFAAKALGDYTNTLKLLQPGTTVDAEGPYGRFLFSDGGSKQVWIAGGIGITPYMSRLRQLRQNTENNTEEIVLYYLVRDEKDALFVSEIKAAAESVPGLTLRIWDSSKSELFKIDNITEMSNANVYSFYICGPPQMLNDIKKGLIKRGVKSDKIYAEEFKLY